MENQQTEAVSNVKTLSPKKVNQTVSPSSSLAVKQETEDFATVMRRNAENAERLKKERLKANQSVLKTYKIKN